MNKTASALGACSRDANHISSYAANRCAADADYFWSPMSRRCSKRIALDGVVSTGNPVACATASAARAMLNWARGDYLRATLPEP